MTSPPRIPAIISSMESATPVATTFCESYPVTRKERYSRISQKPATKPEKRKVKDARNYILAVSRRDSRLAADSRLLSFQEEVAENPHVVNEDFFGKGRLAARIFAERKMDATAVVGFNDEFSLGLICGFQEMGLRVPEDISVMGIDGNDARKYVSPLLTTVSLFPQEQGAMCVRVLLDLIEGKKVRYVTHTGFRLLEGESVLPCASAAGTL